MNDFAAPLDLRPFELLRDGWRFVQPHYFVLLVIFAALSLITGILMRVPYLGGPALFLLFAASNAGVCWYLLCAYQGRQTSFATLVEPMQQQAASLLLLHAVCGGAVAVGLILLLIPGGFLAVALWFTLPLVLLERMPLAAAMMRSWETVQRQLLDYCLLAAALVGVNIIAAVPMGVGLLFSVPASCGALTLVTARALKIGQVV